MCSIVFLSFWRLSNIVSARLVGDHGAKQRGAGIDHQGTMHHRQRVLAQPLTQQWLEVIHGHQNSRISHWYQ